MKLFLFLVLALLLGGCATYGDMADKIANDPGLSQEEKMLKLETLRIKMEEEQGSRIVGHQIIQQNQMNELNRRLRQPTYIYVPR